MRAEDTAHPVSDALGDDRRGDGSVICSDLGDGAHIAACTERPEPDRNDPDAGIGKTSGQKIKISLKKQDFKGAGIRRKCLFYGIFSRMEFRKICCFVLH